MEKEYKLIEQEETERPIEHQQIEITEMVEVKQVVSLQMLEMRIQNIDQQINDLQEQKDKITSQLADIKKSLNLK